MNLIKRASAQQEMGRRVVSKPGRWQVSGKRKMHTPNVLRFHTKPDPKDLGKLLRVFQNALAT